MDLLLGIVPLGADHVQIPRAGLQVSPCHGQLLLLGLILVTQLSVIGGVGRYVQVRDEGLPQLGGAWGADPTAGASDSGGVGSAAAGWTWEAGSGRLKESLVCSGNSDAGDCSAPVGAGLPGTRIGLMPG